MNNTLEYYNKNADQFAQGTFFVDFVKTQERFLSKLKEGSRILDFGCGSGRDTKYFLSKGYEVDATDGSEELCKIACAHSGIEVKQMLFSELNEHEKYDGIWACSSILHLPKDELRPVLQKMADALKQNGRYFTDFTLESFKDYMQDMRNLQIEEYWITGDVRCGRGDEKWLNLILCKSDIH